MGNYKHGKQLEIMSFPQVRKQVAQARLSIEDAAFFWMLYYCGVRKSEAYERVVEDFVVTDELVKIDFHQRKKAGAKVPPLELPRVWHGVDKIIATVWRASENSPKWKAIFVYVNQKRKRTKEYGKWVFPNIQSTRAWQIVKKVLGDRYYPHFLRLNRLSEIGNEPTATLVRLKSFSGIKSIRSLQFYLGISKKEQKEAMRLMDEKMRLTKI